MKKSIAQAIIEAAKKVGATAGREGESLIFVEKNGHRTCIYENIWPNNSAAAFYLASDKATTAKKLEERGVPAVQQMSIAFNEALPMEKAREFFDAVDGKVAVKDNFGSNGIGVVFCHTWEKMEKALVHQLNRHLAVNCSRYIDIANEYRSVVLDGEVELVYLKKRPHVVGDGHSPIISLLASSQYKLVKLKQELAEKLNSVPEEGTVVVLSDQDNLSWGATPEKVEGNGGLFPTLKKIAVQSADTLGMKFCSVDIVLDTAGNLSVMEVNPGIMFDAFIEFSESNRVAVVRIFGKALNKYFGS